VWFFILVNVPRWMLMIVNERNLFMQTVQNDGANDLGTVGCRVVLISKVI